jgi:hypothetical protein
MICKFCGCTNKRACAIPMFTMDDDDIIGRATSVVFPRDVAQLASFTEPCHWIAPNICSAPACVNRAYAERADAIVRLVIADELVA